MKRVQSELFAPYRFLGVVTGDTPPSIRTTFVGKKSSLSILCPIDNVIVQYNGKKLRAIGMSDPLNDKITSVASSSSCVFAAAGSRISVLPFCREVTNFIDLHEKIHLMTLIGSQLVVVDTSSGIHVIDVSEVTGGSSEFPEEGVTLQKSLLLEGSNETFEISAICHPSTLLNKIVVGSDQGTLRIVNIRTGKVVHEFQRNFGSRITHLEQTTALDVLAVGTGSGEVALFNVKMDKVLGQFRHDAKITSVAFRDDGESTMVTADKNGTMAVWNLEKQELIGKITGVHSDEINCLYFIAGEPIMLSASLDNSLRLWIFDSADGMPRELVRLEGHSRPCASAKFVGKNEILTAGKDGSVRKYDVTSLTMRQKLGSVGKVPKGIIAGAQNETKNTVRNVAEIAFGWHREAAWNNVFCRQENDTKVTSWQTRNNTYGGFSLEHDRFKKKVDYIDASATALCVSPCGNFVFIGYSTGHIDQYNAQSGRHVHSFTSTPPKSSKKKGPKRRVPKASFINSNGALQNDAPAADCPITSLRVDQLNKELMSTDEQGHIVFWSLATKQPTARMFKDGVRLGITAQCPANSLVAVVSISDAGKESVVLVDTVCHRVARAFEHVGPKVNAIEFSANGKWLLVADNQSYIRVFDVATSQLIDVLLFSKPCISMAYNETGQFLATVHEGERAIYTWINKLLYAMQVTVKVHEPDYLPTWEDDTDSQAVFIDDSDDEDDTTVMDKTLKALKDVQIDESLVTFSGLPSSRWAHLPDLAMIKERNKPVDGVKKIKQAPFFLAAAATLDGFEFETEAMEEEMDGDSRIISAKRNLLELESSFSRLLRDAKTKQNLLDAFDALQKMSLSGIDFQIRALNPKTLPVFFRMLLEELKTKRNFELVQSYTATALKIHRSLIWNVTDEPEQEELSEVLEELSTYLGDSWNEMENLFVENMAVVQWIKNALL